MDVEGKAKKTEQIDQLRSTADHYKSIGYNMALSEDVRNRALHTAITLYTRAAMLEEDLLKEAL